MCGSLEDKFLRTIYPIAHVSAPVKMAVATHRATLAELTLVSFKNIVPRLCSILSQIFVGLSEVGISTNARQRKIIGCRMFVFNCELFLDLIFDFWFFESLLVIVDLSFD